MLDIEKEKFVCPKCGREFSNRRGLTTHKTCCIVGRVTPKRKPQTKEARKNISESLMGRKLSEEHIESLRRSHTKFSREARICAAPDCTNTFECRVDSDRMYCSTLCANRYGAPAIARDRRRVLRETRTCPGCNTTFEVSIHSTQKFCGTECQLEFVHSCNQQPCSKERAEKISDSISKLYLEGFRPRTSYDAGWVTTRMGEKVYCRSSYEKKAVDILNSFEDVISIKAEPLRIPYEVSGARRFYLPDFLVSMTNGDSYLIEVKPMSQMEEGRNQIKFAAAKRYAKKHNMIFLIWTEDILFNNNGSTTTSLQEIVKATAATLSENGKVMI